MKKIVLLLILCVMMILTSCATSNEIESARKKGEEQVLNNLDRYSEVNEKVTNSYDEGYLEGYSKGYKEGEIKGSERWKDAEYFRFPGFLDDAADTENAFQMLFDVCDEVGYWPSIILGNYCIDQTNEQWMIHYTNSDCIEKIDKNNLSSCLSWGVNSKEEMEKLLEESDFIKEKHCVFCPVCAEKDDIFSY